MLAVFREEEKGPAGLEIVRNEYNVDADFVLALDRQAAKTEPYGVGPPVFNTYLIDSAGTIRAILSGETYDRPTGDRIVNRLEELRKQSRQAGG